MSKSDRKFFRQINAILKRLAAPLCKRCDVLTRRIGENCYQCPECRDVQRK